MLCISLSPSSHLLLKTHNPLYSRMYSRMIYPGCLPLHPWPATGQRPVMIQQHHYQNPHLTSLLSQHQFKLCGSIGNSHLAESMCSCMLQKATSTKLRMNSYVSWPLFTDGSQMPKAEAQAQHKMNKMKTWWIFQHGCTLFHGWRCCMPKAAQWGENLEGLRR
jgi:hypothetical protein